MIKSKQGNLTKEDYKKLAEEVLIKTKDQLSNDTLSLLSRNYDNLNSYIESELEAQLKEVKLQNMNMVTATEYEDALKEIEELKKELAKEQNK